MPEIFPSILAADFTRLGEQVRAVESAGVTALHCDIMDGHFVPNLSIGVPVVASLRKFTRLPITLLRCLLRLVRTVSPCSRKRASTSIARSR